MLFKSFSFLGFGSDCCLGCCGAALLVEGMKRYEGQGGGVGGKETFRHELVAYTGSNPMLLLLLL